MVLSLKLRIAIKLILFGLIKFIYSQIWESQFQSICFSFSSDISYFLSNFYHKIYSLIVIWKRVLVILNGNLNEDIINNSWSL